MSSSTTGPATAVHGRETALALASDGVDVVVIGGGITGVGIALDAASRGLRVALVERDDIASGTSSKSSKLVHGGLRYLANGDVPMVAEGVRERGRLRDNAPHLVRPLSFVVPIDDRMMALKLRAGLTLYDTMALGSRARRRQRLSVSDVRRRVPGLRAGFSQGGWQYDDCQTDDARLTWQIAQRAREHGALVVNHCAVVDVVLTSGRVSGVAVRDQLTGETTTIPCSWAVSAAGVWAADVRDLAIDDEQLKVRPAKGVHLTFPRSLLDVECAVTVPSATDDGRMAFVIPWGDQVYVGTTDDDTAEFEQPALEDHDGSYLLAAVNAAFDLDLTFDDAIGAWAGTRPLLERAGADSKDLSRKHAVIEDPPGFVTITGGKLTTYRQMAEDAVDHLAAAGLTDEACRTVDLRLGVAGDAGASREQARAAAVRLGIAADAVASIWHRHGDRASEVLAFCAEHDETGPLVEGLPYLTGEVRWAVRQEMARSVDDVLQRRTRVSLRHAAAGGPAIDMVADVLAEELGWGDEQRRASIDAYRVAVTHERGPVPLR